MASGVAPATAPDLARDFRLASGLTAGGILLAFHALAVFLEPPLLAWSERVKVRWFCGGALACVGAISFLAAAATGPWLLGLALALYGPASGCALASAEGELVEARPAERERTLARFGLVAGLGDLAVPSLLWLLALVGAGWRAAFAVGGLLALALAARVLCARSLDHRPVPPSSDDEERPATSAACAPATAATDSPESGSTDAAAATAPAGAAASPPPPTLRQALRTALAAPSLLAWCLAAALTNLLDEVLVAFAAVHLDRLGAAGPLRSLALGGWVIGGLLALTVLERGAARLDAHRLLVAAAAASLATVTALALAPSAGLAALALLAVGATATVLHPLASARAYAALPGRPALVNALASALLPLEMALPLAIGLAADRASPAVAVALLALAPIAILGVALSRGGRRSVAG